MPHLEVASEFLDALRSSRILTDDEIADTLYHKKLEDVDDAVQVARTFVSEGLLTRWQASEILRERGDKLIVHGYKLLYPLGQGGMGTIYAAQEIETGWEVAFKVLNADRRKDRGMLSRFQLEAEAGMRLKHPNILRTRSLNKFDDKDGSGYYVVMELVKGASLRELLSLFSKISIGQACDVIQQAALGLHEAHEEGLIHRDVKPENILVRTDGSAKILDFGLAMCDENDEEFTMAMILGQDRLGTADYVAPEQIINSYKVDRRADIYSLGCSLYFALTGKVPFPDTSVTVKLKGHVKRRPTPVEELRDDIPEKLSRIIAKMMSKQPKNRFADAATVAQYLKPFSERAPIEFDFKKLVRAREKLAKRMALKRLSASRSGLPSQSGLGSSVSRSGLGPRSDAETVIRDDTDVDREQTDKDDK